MFLNILNYTTCDVLETLLKPHNHLKHFEIFLNKNPVSALNVPPPGGGDNLVKQTNKQSITCQTHKIS